MPSSLLGDRYRLGPVIGVGGTGAVHRAHDEVLDVDVAVKVLRAGAAEADCERLRREVEYLRAVEHPNLVAVLDLGAAGSDEVGGGRDGVAWFAMELVAGPDLRTLLRDRGPLGGEAVRRLLTGVLGALEAMHAAGLVHRDVTPSNILLTAGPFARWEAKLTDLGIARRLLAVPLTDAGRVVGTAGYLSPEQVAGREVGPATDVYALALVALEALTGRIPFPGSAVESATSRLLRAPSLPADLAPEWRDLLARATSVDPPERPDAATFRAEVLALPEDAGVRPDREAVTASWAEARVPVEPRTSALPRSTAVMPAAAQATGLMSAVATTEFATVPEPRSRGRLVVVGVTAALLVGIATVGSVAFVGSHAVRGADVAVSVDDSTPRPSASASVAPQPEATAPVEVAAVPAGPGAGEAAPDGGPRPPGAGAGGPGGGDGGPAAAAGPAAP